MSSTKIPKMKKRSAYNPTYSEDDFQELLSDESFVNVERLREAAKYGVPSSVRAEVWKILLGVANPDKSKEMSLSKKMQAEYISLQENKNAGVNIDPTVMKECRKEIERYQKNTGGLDFFRNREHRLRFEQLMYLYLSNNSKLISKFKICGSSLASVSPLSSSSPFFFSSASTSTTSASVSPISPFPISFEIDSDEGGWEFDVSMVHVMAPFVYCMEDDVDSYFAFDKMMMFLEYSPVIQQLDKTLSVFLMLFRTFQEELCSYFEDEELSPNEWAIPWIKELLAGSLPLECVVRLWDTYFSCDEGFDLHIYVCLAILMMNTEDLLELEYSDLRVYLKHLPVMNMDQMIMHAYNIRDEVIALKIT